MSRPQLPAQELAGGVARQGGGEVDAPGRLEGRGARAGERDELFGGRDGAGPQDDDGRRHLAPALVGESVDARLQDGGVRHERGLDLRRVDVLAAGDYEVVASVEDVEVAFVVQVAEVAGVEP